jgi:hypothetical protein
LFLKISGEAKKAKRAKTTKKLELILNCYLENETCQKSAFFAFFALFAFFVSIGLTIRTLNVFPAANTKENARVATKRKLTHRQRLLARTIFLSLAILAVAAAIVFYRRPSARYKPDERAAGITSELERRIPADHPRVTFNETARASGVAFRHFFKERSTQLPEDMGSGAAWGDYDNDGDEDLFIVNISGPLTLKPAEAAQSSATCKLYRNNGDGSFTDVTERARLSALSICGQGAAWGDFDGDGKLDLVVTAYPYLFLFRNNGNGAFTDVSARAGLSQFKGFWTGASWADYNQDGNLDLYVCGYVQYRFNADDWNKVSLQFKAEVPFTLNPSSYPPERNLLFRNRGDGSFIEVSK